MLDAKVVALVRLAALIAVGGAVPTYGAEVDDAVSAGATTAEIVDVLAAAIPIVGLPSVVAAAPKVALGLGYDPFDPEARRAVTATARAASSPRPARPLRCVS